MCGVNFNRLTKNNNKKKKNNNNKKRHEKPLHKAQVGQWERKKNGCALERIKENKNQQQQQKQKKKETEEISSQAQMDFLLCELTLPFTCIFFFFFFLFPFLLIGTEAKVSSTKPNAVKAYPCMHINIYMCMHACIHAYVFCFDADGVVVEGSLLDEAIRREGGESN
ncbi:hypothetical protein Tc00.1047053503715.20 [Trypanosoma cruzi]|uniref:Uncharacterized protein n=1 Tax=Trypanosoma cruzi (strain CL Brener) TaxID=353153 RepID=Q4CZR1_TRYCC|nr:hypothetical protein Tc00.1047053503715.20 [Trypanosoma cruzi]EAN85762.1 hypothetical protein Tc00.1047053503715.20 [Trypanosoma cruzi]|eukprot:XP_807613.1 hypothetical protein [Trypanosoma cruzi strain CL Brener]